MTASILARTRRITSMSTPAKWPNGQKMFFRRLHRRRLAGRLHAPHPPRQGVIDKLRFYDRKKLPSIDCHLSIFSSLGRYARYTAQTLRFSLRDSAR